MLSSAVTLMVVYMSALVVNGKPGCVPEKWEGRNEGFTGSISNGTGHLTAVDYKLSYDASIQKVAVSGVTAIDAKTYKIQALQDYKQKTMFTVVDGNCTKTPLPAFPGNCVPTSAEKLGDTYFGADKNTLDIQIYHWNVNSTSVSITFTKGGVPVSESITGGAKTLDFMSVSSYTGMKIGISDPSVFNVPAACRKEEPHGVAEHVVRHMKRKSFLLF